MISGLFMLVVVGYLSKTNCELPFIAYNGHVYYNLYVIALKQIIMQAPVN